MPLVQAWQCPHTGKLFADRVPYQEHLKREARARALQRKVAKAKREFQTFVNEGVKTCSTFSAIEDWIVENGERLCLHASNKVRKNAALPSIPRVAFEDMRWSNTIANTHDCPRNGKTNWSREPDLPKGYPGWLGKIRFTVKNHDMFFGKFLRNLDIHTGSGGGHKDDYKYEVRLYADDWPVMAVTERMRGHL